MYSPSETVNPFAGLFERDSLSRTTSAQLRCPIVLHFISGFTIKCTLNLTGLYIVSYGFFPQFFISVFRFYNRSINHAVEDLCGSRGVFVRGNQTVQYD